MERIASAPNELAHAILVALCDDAVTRRRALKYLDRLQLFAGFRGQESAAAAGAKRKADEAPLEICIRCHGPFVEAENTASACRFHEGDMEVIDELWPDHDERCHGPIQTRENMEECPEGFEWTCCGRPTTEPGCRKGWHKSATAKHPKYDDSRSFGEPTTDEESEVSSNPSETETSEKDKPAEVNKGET
ncbi:hypothetical protein GQ53DRAFT_755744 [Thozetella sp. PMI_491]|nr:hypothetical protein GQ53DRAFT_755744 [Thozetella sp. PMI_491]